MSNGHCVPVRYAAMANAGYFDRKELLTPRKLGCDYRATQKEPNCRA